MWRRFVIRLHQIVWSVHVLQLWYFWLLISTLTIWMHHFLVCLWTWLLMAVTLCNLLACENLIRRVTALLISQLVTRAHSKHSIRSELYQILLTYASILIIDELVYFGTICTCQKLPVVYWQLLERWRLPILCKHLVLVTLLRRLSLSLNFLGGLRSQCLFVAISFLDAWLRKWFSLFALHGRCQSIWRRHSHLNLIALVWVSIRRVIIDSSLLHTGWAIISCAPRLCLCSIVVTHQIVRLRMLSLNIALIEALKFILDDVRSAIAIT